MSRSTIIYLQELVVTQMNHWILFPLFMMPVCQMQKLSMVDGPDILFWAAMGIIPFVFYILRRNVPHFIVLIISHLAVFAMFMCLLNRVMHSGKTLYLLFGIGYVIYSLYLRLSQENLQDKEFFMPVAVGIFWLSSFFAHYLGCLSWDLYYIYALIGVLGLYFFHFYLRNYLEFLLLNEHSAGYIPEREIFASGSRLVLFFTGGSMLFLFLLSGTEWLYGILNLLKTMFLTVLRFIFSLFPIGDEENVQIMPEAQAPILRGDLGLPEADDEHFLLWDILFGILAIMIFCGILYGFILVVKRFLLFLKSRIYYKADNTVMRLGCVSDVHEKCTIKDAKDGKFGGKVSIWDAFSPKEKIRKLYKKHIRVARMIPGKYGGKNLDTFTAREWGGFLEEANMADIYEKARYSNEICTTEDVRHMKEAVKG